MDYLWDGEAGNGEPGDGVGAEEAEAVLGSPVEDGEEVLQGEDELLARRLVLEAVQRVVGEEDLRQPLPQRLARRPPLRRRHLVPLNPHRRHVDRPVVLRRRRHVHLGVVDDHGGIGRSALAGLPATADARAA